MVAHDWHNDAAQLLWAERCLAHLFCIRLGDAALSGSTCDVSGAAPDAATSAETHEHACRTIPWCALAVPRMHCCTRCAFATEPLILEHVDTRSLSLPQQSEDNTGTRWWPGLCMPQLEARHTHRQAHQWSDGNGKEPSETIAPKAVAHVLRQSGEDVFTSSLGHSKALGEQARHHRPCMCRRVLVEGGVEIVTAHAKPLSAAPNSTWAVWRHLQAVRPMA